MKKILSKILAISLIFGSIGVEGYSVRAESLGTMEFDLVVTDASTDTISVQVNTDYQYNTANEGFTYSIKDASLSDEASNWNTYESVRTNNSFIELKKDTMYKIRVTFNGVDSKGNPEKPVVRSLIAGTQGSTPSMKCKYYTDCAHFTFHRRSNNGEWLYVVSDSESTGKVFFYNENGECDVWVNHAEDERCNYRVYEYPRYNTMKGVKYKIGVYAGNSSTGTLNPYVPPKPDLIGASGNKGTSAVITLQENSLMHPDCLVDVEYSLDSTNWTTLGRYQYNKRITLDYTLNTSTYFRVRYKRKAEYSNWSESKLASVVTDKPNSPTGLAQTTEGNATTITWDCDGSDEHQHTLSLLKGDNTGSPAVTTGIVGSSYTLYDLQLGVKYTVMLQCVAEGVQSDQASMEFTLLESDPGTPDDPEDPGAPNNPGNPEEPGTGDVAPTGYTINLVKNGQDSAIFKVQSTLSDIPKGEFKLAIQSNNVDVVTRTFSYYDEVLIPGLESATIYSAKLYYSEDKEDWKDLATLQFETLEHDMVITPGHVISGDGGKDYIYVEMESPEEITESDHYVLTVIDENGSVIYETPIFEFGSRIVIPSMSGCEEYTIYLNYVEESQTYTVASKSITKGGKGNSSEFPIYSVNLKGVTGNSATFDWKTVGQQPDTRTVKIYSENEFIKDFTVLKAPFTIDGLKPDTQYTLVVPFQYQNCEYRYQQVFKTDESVNPDDSKEELPKYSVVTGFTQLDGDVSSVIVSWDKSTDGASAYELTYREVGATDWIWIETAGTFRSIEGLKDGTSYELRIRAKNREVVSDWFETEVVTRPDGRISEIKPSKVTTNSITVNWSTLKGANAYVLEYSSAGSDRVKTETLYDMSTFTLKGLSPDSKYSFEVFPIRVSKDKKVESGYDFGAGNMVEVETLPGKITAPKDLKYINSKALTFSSGTTPTAKGYEWELWTTSKKKLSGKSKWNTITVKNKLLNTNTVYRIRVRAVGTYGKGAWSDWRYFSKQSTISKIKKSGSTGAKITWKKTSGAQRYILYGNTKKSGKYKKLTTTKKTSCTVKKIGKSKLKKGKNYYFYVCSQRKINGKWVTLDVTPSKRWSFKLKK